MPCLHLYTGSGKGKTTAAMGLALRSAGHGLRVVFAQFMKDGTSGELVALRMLPSVTILPSPLLVGFLWEMDSSRRQACARETETFVRQLTESLPDLRPDLLVLDELSEAEACGLISVEAAQRLVQAALAVSETVVTGRSAPEWLLQDADYISRIECVRHPYETGGLKAREGIEY